MVKIIPGKENIEADQDSRKFQDTTEWQLNPEIYKAVYDTFGTPEIDLYVPVGSTDKLKNMSPGNQNQKLLQLMPFL